MKLTRIEEYINSLFKTTDNPEYHSESGVTYDAIKNIERIGYCTNLTPSVIEKAKTQGVDLIITHHDAWDFIPDLKEVCTGKLKEYGISHYYNHLPLDDCEFGTNDSLVEKLGLNLVEKTHEFDGFKFGRIGEYEEKIEFTQLVSVLEKSLDESVKSWQFNDRKVKRVGLVCGNGGQVDCMKVAVDKSCDVYITGENDLYTIQYAQLKGLNLIIGSHTFTELFGIENLALKLKSRFEEIEIVKIQEEHLETQFNRR